MYMERVALYEAFDNLAKSRANDFIGLASDIKSLSKSPELGFGEPLRVIDGAKQAVLLLMQSRSLMASCTILWVRLRRKEIRVGIKSRMLAVLITLGMQPSATRQ
jgi:hypothetical protein